MRFLGKYELLEQLTVGSVETFVAYPIGGGERLLIHVFALPALIKSGLKNSDLLEYMEAMSPRAMGTLLDAGRYDDGTQAFVVTKFPREASALPRWIEAYKAISRKQDTTTAEVSARQFWGTSPSESEPPSAPKTEVPLGEFTRAFRGVAPNPPEDEHAEDVPANPPPLSGTNQANMDTAVQVGVFPDKPALSESAGGLGEGIRLTSSLPSSDDLNNSGSVTPLPTRNTTVWDTNGGLVPGDRDGSLANSPGEFTNFFKGPLAPARDVHESVGEDSPMSLRPEPSRGEFTKLFGSSQPKAVGGGVAPEPQSKPVRENQGFTDIFGKPAPVDSEEPDRFDASRPVLRSAELSPALKPLPVEAEPSAEPIFRPGPVLVASDHPPQAQGAEATYLFKMPAQESAPPEAPPGESEYTRVVSAKAKPPAPTTEAGTGKAAPPNPLPAFSIPAVPSLTPPHSPTPAIPSLTHPHSPSPGLIVPPTVPWPAPPVPPTLKTPNVPASGKVAGRKASKWTTYAPLIVILNLLLLAALGLVLYFTLNR